MIDQNSSTTSGGDAHTGTCHLSTDAAIKVHLRLAKQAIASGENDLRRAAKHIFEASKQGASQRQIASAIGKSVSTVNRLLSWFNSGYRDETPFGPESKAKRERARVRATERINDRRKSRSGAEQDELAAALARAKAAQVEAAKASAEAKRATDEAMRAKAEAIRAQIRAESAYAEARAARLRLNTHEHPIDGDTRDLLVKALGMLGSDHAGERANAAVMAERQRAKLGMTWDELIIPADEAEAGRRDGAADLHTSN